MLRQVNHDSSLQGFDGIRGAILDGTLKRPKPIDPNELSEETLNSTPDKNTMSMG